MLDFLKEFLPVVIVAAIIGSFATAFLIAWFALKKKKDEGDDRERKISDKELIARLLKYAKPYWKNFVLCLLIMLFSVVYDVTAPWLMGEIQDLIKADFELKDLYMMVGLYASILGVSVVCTYFQAMILQKTGQKILSQIRLDTFTKIEQLSHEQLNNIPVGKLVTRVTNDPNRISFMFTNILVTLVKNSMVIIGVLTAMFILNYALTLMILCFVPFVVFFTLIFRQFSRRVHRKVTNATTDINTYLSENLSGMKITQIFNREDRKMEDFAQRSANLKKAKQNRMYVFGIFRPMVYMLFVSSQLCLFYFAARGYIHQTAFMGQVIDGAIVVSFYGYISRFFNPIQT